jgi:hypothetical protein
MPEGTGAATEAAEAPSAARADADPSSPTPGEPGGGGRSRPPGDPLNRPLDPTLAKLPAQEIVFQLVTPPGVVLTGATVELDRPDGTRVVGLRDDGTVKLDVPKDGVFVGRDVGPWVRSPQLRVLVQEPGRPVEVLVAGVVRTDDIASAVVTWRVERTQGQLQAVRASTAYPAKSGHIPETLPSVATLLWGCFVLMWMGVLLRARLLRRGEP